MSSIELRSIMAAQIMSGLATQLAPHSAEGQVKEYVELAVELAKRIEQEASRSLGPG